VALDHICIFCPVCKIWFPIFEPYKMECTLPYMQSVLMYFARNHSHNIQGARIAYVEDFSDWRDDDYLFIRASSEWDKFHREIRKYETANRPSFLKQCQWYLNKDLETQSIPKERRL